MDRSYIIGFIRSSFALGGLLLFAGLSLTSSAQAATVTLRVNNRADRDAPHFCTGGLTACTLRTAFRLANDNPQHKYLAKLEAQGTYALTSTLVLRRGSLSLVSNFDAVSKVVLDARDKVRAIEVRPSGQDRASLTLHGLIVRRGYESVTGGGGIFAYGRSTLTLNRAIVEDSQSIGFGAGILVDGGSSLRMLRSTIRGNENHSSACGGGLFRSGGGVAILGGARAVIHGSTIEENHACRGGGLLVSGSDLAMTSSTLSNNVAETRGGGLLALGNNTLTLKFNTVTQNVAGLRTGDHLNYGGGLAFATPRGRILLSGNLIAGNEFVGTQSKVLAAAGTMGHDCFIEGNVPVRAGSGRVPADVATYDTYGNHFGTIGRGVSRLGQSGEVPVGGGQRRTVSNCGVLAERSTAGRDSHLLDPDLQLIAPADGSVPFFPPHYEARAASMRRDNFRMTGNHRCLAVDQRERRRPLAPDQCEIGSVETDGQPLR